MVPIKSGLSLFKLFGFEVKLDWSWFFLAILLAWSLAVGYFPLHYTGLSKSTYWIMGIVGTLGLFLSIILHELSHSLVGRHYGIPISSITLFIFGGIAEMNKDPSSPKAEFYMSVVGPLVSLILAIFCLFLFKITSAAGWPVYVTGVISYLYIVNFVVGIFNLLPGFPLDGGRILRSILWWLTKDLKWATRVASQGGIFFGYLMIFYGVFLFIQGALISGLWGFLLGFFLQHISKVSYEQLLIKEIFGSEHIKKYAKKGSITVPSHITVQELIDNYFYKYYYKFYPVIKDNNLVGYISFDEIQDVAKEQWPALAVEKIMRQCTTENTVDIDTEMTQILEMMTTQRISRLMVTEHGALYGIITLKDVMDVLYIRKNLETKDQT